MEKNETINRYRTLTEQAIILLNNQALFIHPSDFKRRLNRLVFRLTGDRIISKVWRINRPSQVYILEEI
jgi:hypothetical protein